MLGSDKANQPDGPNCIDAAWIKEFDELACQDLAQLIAAAFAGPEQRQKRVVAAQWSASQWCIEPFLLQDPPTTAPGEEGKTSSESQVFAQLRRLLTMGSSSPNAKQKDPVELVVLVPAQWVLALFFVLKKLARPYMLLLLSCLSATIDHDMVQGRAAYVADPERWRSVRSDVLLRVLACLEYSLAHNVSAVVVTMPSRSGKKSGGSKKSSKKRGSRKGSRGSKKKGGSKKKSGSRKGKKAGNGSAMNLYAF